MYDHHAVARGMHVELYGVGAQLDGLLERRDGVLGQAVMRAPVGDRLGDWSLVTLRSVGPHGSNFGYDDREAMSPARRGQPSLTDRGPERLPDEAP